MASKGWLTEADRIQLRERGVTEEQLEEQLRRLREGFPPLRLKAAAAVGRGIAAPDEEAQAAYAEAWETYKREGYHRVTKFVPASGAASRMFKDLFAFLEADYEVPTTDFECRFFGGLHEFAFFPALDDACRVTQGEGADALVAEGRYKAVVECLLGEEGLNYGQLPKGLLQFHAYDEEARTPVEEHLAEAAAYAASEGVAEVHFTVSGEHRALFEELVERVVPECERHYGVTFRVSFSEQKPSTDMVAATPEGEPFRTDDGRLLFRPGGHGALIYNLGELESDVVFVKNIDNVVPDRLKADTVRWKGVIAGMLVSLQRRVFRYLEVLDSGRYGHDELVEMVRFVRHELSTDVPGLKTLEDAELVVWLRSKLNRPMRVCGVVRNVGEPGGGPFLAYDNRDGSVAPQILESSQIDSGNAEYTRMFAEGTHFNPVDLVCAIRDYKGRRFDLSRYVDPDTGFISRKSKGGRELKALELPGLWNGAMSDWTTVFVDVPLSTFNPVKTVNDLLRDQHQ